MNKTHGMSHQRLHNIWLSMRQRCEKPRCSGYWKYGAKGIRVCEEWSSFEVFRDWAFENGYSDNLTIDRIDPKGNYEPSNCRWVTQKVQQNNRSNNVYITYNGETHNIEEWSKLTGISSKVIYNRNHRGWSPERIFQQRVRKSPRKAEHEEKKEVSMISIRFEKESDETKVLQCVYSVFDHPEIYDVHDMKPYGRSNQYMINVPKDEISFVVYRNETGFVFDFRQAAVEKYKINEMNYY